MVEFVSIFLGLVVGVQPIHVNVSTDVTTVEIQLDGELVGTLEGKPWMLHHDFGQKLVPRELLAIARDATGLEVDRARQWLNVPVAPVEARFAVEGRGAAATASLSWQTLDFEAPEEVNVFFDGEPLEAADLEHIELPRHDPKEPHFLRAEVVFSQYVQTHAEHVFGGVYGEKVDAELTSLPVVLEGRRLPKPKAMQGWFTKQGQAVSVLAIERGPIDLIVLREKSERNINGLLTLSRNRGLRAGAQVPIPAGLAPGDRLRFMHPVVQRIQLQKLFVDRMPMSKNKAHLGPMFNSLTGVFFKGMDEPLERQRLADAVAVAGLTAAGGQRRRAVLLLRSGGTVDESRLSVEAVRGYLRILGVPLIVWTPDRDAAPRWGEELDVSSLRKLGRAIDGFREAIDAQAIVWLQGGHLPGEIELSASARGVRLVE